MAGTVTPLIVLALALYVCWLMLQPFFNVLLWAMVLTVFHLPSGCVFQHPAKA
jgi:hypothetical protein